MRFSTRSSHYRHYRHYPRPGIPRLNRPCRVIVALFSWLSIVPPGLASEAVDAPPESAEQMPLVRCHALDDTGDETAQNCYLELLRSELDDAVRGEALWRMGNTGAANRAFRRANQTDPGNPELLTRWGLLFIEVHQAADAEALFTEALTIDPLYTDALLGQAKLLADRFEGRAQDLISEVLTREPEHPGANVLLARLHLEVGNVDTARTVLTGLIDNTLETGERLDSYALLAAADHVSGETPSPWTTRALELNPKFGDIYAVPAHFYVITRRYTEAVELLEQATRINPDHWPAHADLGINLLRLNRFVEAREHLEAAYSGDPYNAEVVNTLRLLDSLSNFDTISSANLVMRLHKSESSVLAPYVREFVRDTEEIMAPRYRYKLERPVVIELYQHHDDFAVRTAGLPGIGILGATFGDVVVMDGPSAKTAADGFDWVSALWHELAHVVTLNATNNLVSRWFAEGVSVFEEWRYGPSPNNSVPFSFLEAMKDDRLLPVADLDEGFIRPRYPEQISVSYLQSGLLCLFIADNFDDGLNNILEAYGDGATTVEAINRGLSLTPEELDEVFADYLDERFGGVLARLDELRETTRDAAAAFKAGRWTDAMTSAEQAIDLYPAYVGPASAYLLLARAAEHGKIPEKRMAALEGYWRAGGRDPGALNNLAQGYHDDARLDEAIAVQSVLARAVPLEAEHHAKLGDWLSAAGRHTDAVFEYESVLALAPHDKASAHFKLASALHQLDRTKEALRELLYALEIAPRFRPALLLLVEINQ
ncbi:MAG: tetratricopeptide repeat protein [Gammaproteobacteria bacterium]|nr:tetratricopeptide repeat protein [Gammaproteobacteria bacterium]